MSLRFTLHFLICVLFAALGWWLFLQLRDNTSASITSIHVAGYWFGFLVFILFSWFFYWILHRRSTKAWFISLMIAGFIAVISTGAMVIVSHDHEQQRQAKQEVLNKDQETEIIEEKLEEELEELKLDDEENKELLP